MPILRLIDKTGKTLSEESFAPTGAPLPRLLELAKGKFRFDSRESDTYIYKQSDN